MDTLTTESPPVVMTARPPKIWKFWGTTLWGLFICAALLAGQLAVFGFFVWQKAGPLHQAARMAASGLGISLSVIMSVPAVAVACWIAIRPTRTSFADYLALRRTTWKNLAIGVVSLFVLIACGDLLSMSLGREITPGFMGDVLKSARADGALWVLVIAFCVAAPISEEFFARGFLYRGWSETFLRPAGAIVLSSIAWTALHLQYDLFFLGEVFSIGLLFGYLRYRTGSTWLTIVLHGVNNLAATLQTIWLTS